ncbi:MAG: universal stress protein [Mycobacterium sp.]|nr:universal stress protein [Mycobacterium sp.]
MSPQQMHRGIVVGVDGSAYSTVAVKWAAREAVMRDVPLRLVNVVSPDAALAGPWPQTPLPSEFFQWQEDRARQIIEDAHKNALEAASPTGTPQVDSELLYSPVVSTLVALSKEADMVVVGRRGEGAVARALLGSVSSHLVHHAHCPVAVIHDEDPLTTRPLQAPVVVGIDGSPTSELATEIAFDEAALRGVGLVALHAWSDMGPLNFGKFGQAPIEWANFKVREEEVLAERLAGWQDQFPDVDVHRIVVSDSPTPRLLEQAETAQLLVVGSHGRGGFTGMLLGSVSGAVVNTAQIPVIVARMPR